MWKLIEQINWKKVSSGKYNSDAVKRTVMEMFTEKTCKEIRAFASDRHSDLYAAVEKYEKENDCHCGDYGGDDSFGDMLWQVVGLGKAKFNKVMKDPTVLNGMPFVECFGYVLPYDDDYVVISEDHHINNAKNAIAALSEIVTHSDPLGADNVRIIKDIMGRFLTVLEGDYKGAVKGFDKKKYSEYSDFDGNTHHAMFANYLSDVKTYLV